MLVLRFVIVAAVFVLIWVIFRAPKFAKRRAQDKFDRPLVWCAECESMKIEDGKTICYSPHIPESAYSAELVGKPCSEIHGTYLCRYKFL